MLDPKLIRSDLEAVVVALGRRGYVVDEAALSELEVQRRSLQAALETLQAERNSRSKEIGALMKQGDQAAAEAAKAEVSIVSDNFTDNGDRFQACHVHEFDCCLGRTCSFFDASGSSFEGNNVAGTNQ